MLKKKASLYRIIQIVEHFKIDRDWLSSLRQDYDIISYKETPSKEKVISFLETEATSRSADLFNQLKDRELITRDEVMMLLSISSATVSRWQADGILKAYSVAKTSRVYFRFSEIIDSLVELRPHV